MNKWIVEDWAFNVEVIEGEADNCRLGLEKGDTFHFEYETSRLLSTCHIGNLYLVRSNSLWRQLHIQRFERKI